VKQRSFKSAVPSKSRPVPYSANSDFYPFPLTAT
jgi:hypothetical protein